MAIFGSVAALALLAGCTLFNSPPVASFTVTPASGPAPLSLHYDGSGSSDPDGDVLTYAWNFGDSTPASSAASGFHTYTAPGTYEIRLVVTDPNGQEAMMSRSVLVTEPENEAPSAEFTAAPTSGEAPLSVAFNGSASNDPDGTTLTFEWDFGDGSTSSAPVNIHTYSSQGAYIVTLTVTDADGLSDTATTAILVTEPGNAVPVASFSADPETGFFPFDVQFDATSSYDPDGTIVAYQWDFGDGGTGSGATITHTFESVGTFTVVLTVIDNDGAPASYVVEISSLFTIFWPPFIEL